MAASNEEQSPNIFFDCGTAYDFFVSLTVLHYPAKFGLRGAWAAGVRSRLSQEDREFLEDVLDIFTSPYSWVSGLPDPKDADTVLYALKQIPAMDRLPSLMLQSGKVNTLREGLEDVLSRGQWTEEDREFVTNKMRQRSKEKGGSGSVSPRVVEKMLNFYANAEDFGERYLTALQSYHEVFFAEEEKRIKPKLKEALAKGQKLAEEAPFAELLETLSRGVQFEELPQTERWLLAPSYWHSPLILPFMINESCMLFLYGARPSGESLVPGEEVPDDLLLMLKSLADPTRLRILRYLIQEQLTPAELSRRLRLRAPTVTHHLHTLRLAGLVRFVMRGKSERLYFARMESVMSIYSLLKDFLEEDVRETENIDVLDRGRVY
jgi:DNA-binding transcriptional ArsR family regulator